MEMFFLFYIYFRCEKKKTNKKNKQSIHIQAIYSHSINVNGKHCIFFFFLFFFLDTKISHQHEITGRLRETHELIHLLTKYCFNSCGD